MRVLANKLIEHEQNETDQIGMQMKEIFVNCSVELCGNAKAAKSKNDNSEWWNGEACKR